MDVQITPELSEHLVESEDFPPELSHDVDARSSGFSGHPSCLEDELKRAGDFSWLQMRMLTVMAYQWLIGSMQTYSGVFFMYHAIECRFRNDPKCDPLRKYTIVDMCVNNARNPHLIFDPNMTSVVEEFDLICADNRWVNFAISMWFVGFLCGVSVFGRISDQCGRVTALIGVFALGAAATMLQAVSPTIQWYCAARLLNGSSVGAGGMCSFILASELTRSSFTVGASAIANASFGVGYASLALLAYLVPQWRTLSWLNCASYSLFLILLIPRYHLLESPCWLVSRRRFADAALVFARIAKINGRSTSDFESRAETVHSEAVVPLGPLMDSWTQMFVHPVLRIRLLVIAIVWYFVLGAVYGVGMNAGGLRFHTSIYVTAALLAVMDLPSALAVSVLPNYTGRKFFSWAAGVLGGILCVLSSLTYFNDSHLALAMCLVSRFFLNSMFDMMYCYAYELVPTSLRNQSCGLLSTIAHSAGATLSAWVSTVSDDAIPGVHSPVLFIVGIPCAVFSLLILWLLPETYKKPIALVCADL